MDTGSPISLITQSTFVKILNDVSYNKWSPNLAFKGLNNSKVNTLGWICVPIELEQLRNYKLKVKLFVVPDNTIAYEILVGRDLLYDNELRLLFSHRGVQLEALSEQSKEALAIFNINVITL